MRCPSYRTGKWLPIQGNTICRAHTKARRNMIRSENRKICERRIDEHKTVLFKDREIAAAVPFQNRAINSTFTAERKSTTGDLWFRFVRMDTKVQAWGRVFLSQRYKAPVWKKNFFSAKERCRSFGYCNKRVNCMSLTNMNWTVSQLWWFMQNSHFCTPLLQTATRAWQRDNRVSANFAKSYLCELSYSRSNRSLFPSFSPNMATVKALV